MLVGPLWQLRALPSEAGRGNSRVAPAGLPDRVRHRTRAAAAFPSVIGARGEATMGAEAKPAPPCRDICRQ